jgi:hypothetical protein
MTKNTIHLNFLEPLKISQQGGLTSLNVGWRESVKRPAFTYANTLKKNTPKIYFVCLGSKKCTAFLRHAINFFYIQQNAVSFMFLSFSIPVKCFSLTMC